MATRHLIEATSFSVVTGSSQRLKNFRNFRSICWTSHGIAPFSKALKENEFLLPCVLNFRKKGSTVISRFA
jgi:hypothetical protein